MGTVQVHWSKSLWQRGTRVTLLLLALGGMTVLYFKMHRVDPSIHRQVDRALRDMRGLDRTINQDVLRARYRLTDSYNPVLKSYRELEKLEDAISDIPPYLERQTAQDYALAVKEYRRATTAKQRAIETFKYRSADLNILLNYLPGAGISVAKAANTQADREFVVQTNGIVSLALLYNLTSDESYAPQILERLKRLETQALDSESPAVKRQTRKFVRNVRELLQLKPEVDSLLRSVFAAPIAAHEENVAELYYAGYATVEAQAERYRLLLYAMSIVLLISIGVVLMRLRFAAHALAQSNEGLEVRVKERTHELDSRNVEIRAVLDNIAQALLTVNRDGRISRERSAKIESWLPAAEEGDHIWDVLRLLDPTAAEWLALGWEELIDDVMPEDLILDQLPKRFSSEHQHFDIEYRPIGTSGERTASGEMAAKSERAERYLLVISDITDTVAQQKRELEQQEQLVAFQHFVNDRAGFLEFVAECERILEHLAECQSAPGEAFRAVHTLKGNCGLFGVRSVAIACHELESKMVEQPELTTASQAGLTACWETFRKGFLALTGEQNNAKIEFHADDLEQLRRIIRAGAPASELLGLLDRLQRVPVRSRLDRLAEHARDLATRLGKGEIRVVVEDYGLRLDDERWAPFWAASIHVLRNAIDHGLESADVRTALRKDPCGTLRISIREDADTLIVEFADDGQGIDWQAVREKAARLGLETATQDELQALLFHGGISTKDAATEYSGRGAGVSAAYEACDRLGGVAEIESTLGKGTVFRFRIPHDDTVPRRSVLPPGSVRFLSGYPQLPSSQRPANAGQNVLRSDRERKV